MRCGGSIVLESHGVIAVQSGSLDRAYLQQWAGEAGELGFSEKLNQLLARVIKPKST